MLLPPAIREKARTLLLLSLGSDSVGERQNATTALARLLKANGHDLHDMAAALVEAPPPPPPPRIRKRAGGEDYEIVAADLQEIVDRIRGGGRLDDYNVQFLDDMEVRAAKYRVVRLSERQLGHLTRLLESS